jgi:hypothetical protein
MIRFGRDANKKFTFHETVSGKLGAFLLVNAGLAVAKSRTPQPQDESVGWHDRIYYRFTKGLIPRGCLFRCINRHWIGATTKCCSIITTPPETDQFPNNTANQYKKYVATGRQMSSVNDRARCCPATVGFSFSFIVSFIITAKFSPRNHPPQCVNLLGAFLRVGLARAFRAGIEHALSLGADNQHCADDIPALIDPILKRRAQIVVMNTYTLETITQPV